MGSNLTSKIHKEIMFRIQSILLCAFIFYSSGIQAQDKHSIYTADSLSESQFSTTSYLSSAQDVKVPFKERWAISTNAVDWILTIPNARVEFDLSNSNCIYLLYLR